MTDNFYDKHIEKTLETYQRGNDLDPVKKDNPLEKKLRKSSKPKSEEYFLILGNYKVEKDLEG